MTEKSFQNLKNICYFFKYLYSLGKLRFYCKIFGEKIIIFSCDLTFLIAVLDAQQHFMTAKHNGLDQKL